KMPNGRSSATPRLCLLRLGGQRPVAAEAGFRHSLAAGQAGQLPLQLLGPGRGQERPQRREIGMQHRGSRRPAEPGHRGQHGTGRGGASGAGRERVVWAGIWRLGRIIGSQTPVPAWSSAAIRTWGVSLRKWAAVVDGDMYAQSTIVTVQSVTRQPNGPWRNAVV